jgi:c-di-GMP-binding flagellar brake protein YcgR
MAESQADILRSAIVRNAAVVLSLPSAGLLRHYKSRFLAEAEHGDDAAFWVESQPEERPLIDELISTKKPAAISFKNGTNKVVFLSPIVVQDLQHALNAETTVPAILMKWPAEIKSIQRRNNYRVRVVADSEILARIWRIPEHAYLGDRPMAALELPLQLRDLSIGGIGVNFLPKDGEPVKVSSADRLRIQLTLRDEPLLLEGRMRYPEQAPKAAMPVRAGIQFKTLESDLEGRQKLASLTRVVGEMQREEVRRFRLGMAG